MSNVMFLCIALALVTSPSQVPKGAVYKSGAQAGAGPDDEKVYTDEEVE